MDEDAAWHQNTPLLARDLRSHSIVIAPPRIRLPEFGRSEEATVLHPIERCIGEEVERAGPTEIGAMVLETLAPGAR